MKKYAVVIEKGGDNLSTYVPDLPGCITTGKSISEIMSNMQEAIEFHLDGLREDGLPIPEPSVVAVEVEVAA